MKIFFYSAGEILKCASDGHFNILWGHKSIWQHIWEWQRNDTTDSVGHITMAWRM